MLDWAAIEASIDSAAGPVPLLAAAEGVLEQWLKAHGQNPTHATKEGFRLIALHAQGTKGDPSFNACRETCREAVYHFNLLQAEFIDEVTRTKALHMMQLVVRHLFLFISGKLETAGLGEFCCAAKPVRAKDAALLAEG